MVQHTSAFAARLLHCRDIATKISLGGLNENWYQVMTFSPVKKLYFSYLRNKL